MDFFYRAWHVVQCIFIIKKYWWLFNLKWIYITFPGLNHTSTYSISRFSKTVIRFFIGNKQMLMGWIKIRNMVFSLFFLNHLKSSWGPFGSLLRLWLKITNPFQNQQHFFYHKPYWDEPCGTSSHKKKNIQPCENADMEMCLHSGSFIWS